MFMGKFNVVFHWICGRIISIANDLQIQYSVYSDCSLRIILSEKKTTLKFYVAQF